MRSAACLREAASHYASSRPLCTIDQAALFFNYAKHHDLRNGSLALLPQVLHRCPLFPKRNGGAPQIRISHLNKVMPRNLYINTREILRVIADYDVVVGLTPCREYGMPVPDVK